MVDLRLKCPHPDPFAVDVNATKQFVLQIDKNMVEVMLPVRDCMNTP